MPAEAFPAQSTEGIMQSVDVEERRPVEKAQSKEGTGAEVVKTAPPPTSCMPGLSKLLPLAIRPYRHTKLSSEQIQHYMTLYGGRALSYTHLHKCYKQFEVPGLGVVSYVPIWTPVGRTSVVMIDPLAAPGDRMLNLLRRFHKTVPGWKLYAAVSEHVADALRKLGYDTTVLATDYYADLNVWSLTRKSSLVRYHKQGRNAGLQAKELTWDEVDGARVREISENWLKTKKNGGSELQMMTWPYYEGDEPGCRKFYGYNEEGTLIAYIFFLPCYENGRVIGYCANVLRRDPESKPTYILDFVLMSAVEQFRKEGVQFLSLAFALMHGLEKAPGDSAIDRLMLRVGSNMRIWPYAIKNVAAHKDHYKVNRLEKLYLGRKTLAMPSLYYLPLYTVTNLLPVAKLLHGIES